MNQNLNQHNNKDDTIKIVLIICGTIFCIALAGIAGLAFLFYTIFNKSIDFIDKNKDEIIELFDNTNYDTSEDDEEDYESDSSSDNDNPIIEDGYSNIEQVTLTELKRLIEEKKPFILLVSQTTCSHCIVFKPIYNEALKENKVTGLELDLLTLSKEEKNEAKDLLEVSGTPTTMIFIDGEKQTEVILGTQDKEYLSNYFKKYGFSKE